MTKINPPAWPSYCLLPFVSISHHYFSALFIVNSNSHVEDIRFALNSYSFTSSQNEWKLCLETIPNFLSISYSTGKPWQSHPNRRMTWKPVAEAYRVITSFKKFKIWFWWLLSISKCDYNFDFDVCIDTDINYRIIIMFKMSL